VIIIREADKSLSIKSIKFPSPMAYQYFILGVRKKTGKPIKPRKPEKN